MCVARSLIHIRNTVGQKTEPCGTPDVTLHGVEHEPSTTTHCNLLDINDLIHCSWITVHLGKEENLSISILVGS